MLQTALDHYERQQRITAAALVAAKRKGLSTERIAQIVAAFQLLAARDALASVPQMLEEQNIVAPAAGVIAPASFAGTASDGRPLGSLLAQSTSPYTLGLMVATQVQDAARTAAGVSVAARGVRYARMLNPPSCSRCVILAGREYRSIDAFPRHPGCDCRHVPTSESLAGDLTTDPQAYFDSLNEAGRLKFAGSKSNLRAIEDGADPTQIVNAYRRTSGMQAAGESPIKISDSGLKFTTEGTTKRGLAAKAQANLRRNGPSQQRLMPESIYKRAQSAEDAQRLLRLYGWIL